ncbi:MAG: Uma2 family endonuclease [Planctomycetota bacterium]
MIANTVQESRAPYGVKTPLRTEQAERRVVLHGVSWETYKALSRDIGDSRSCRLAFDSGALEIMSPLIPHENSQLSIGRIVLMLAEEIGIPCCALGALTCECEVQGKAIEPDGCFYIQNLHRVKGLKKLDFTIHPAPDLMVEVDMNTNSMSKLAICAALGVPEHWRFDGEKLEIRLLKGGQYFESNVSLAFPEILFAHKITDFIPSGIDDSTSFNHKFRTWIRSELRKQKASKSAPKKSRKKSV